jgi:CubicO group peptidase (beta-lactamase class C family)
MNHTKTVPLVWQEVDPASVGMSRAGVQEIERRFEAQFARGLHYAAQLVVVRHGRVVLDRTIGVLRRGQTKSVRPTTPFQNFSVSKAFTAVCIHKLIEQGLVEMDAPIGDYWPEFACKGKETATIRHAFLHQMGIPARGIYPQIPRWWRWDRVVGQVANLTAEYEPGTRTAYHLVNNGFVFGELVRRITGQPIEQYMQEQIFEPLGMRNSYLGLPRSEIGRAAQVYWGATDQRGAVLLFRQARHAVMPAATLNAPARELAVFYQMMLNGGQYAGHCLMRPETVRLATSVGYEGMDETLEIYAHWGYGFGISGPKPPDAPNADRSIYGEGASLTTFGHAGQRSSLAWADSEQQIVFAFTCNRLLADEDSSARWQELGDALWSAVVDL